MHKDLGRNAGFPPNWPCNLVGAASWVSSFYLPSPNNSVAATALSPHPGPPGLVTLCVLLMVTSRVLHFCFFRLSHLTHFCLKLAQEMYKGQNTNIVRIINGCNYEFSKIHLRLLTVPSSDFVLLTQLHSSIYRVGLEELGRSIVQKLLGQLYGKSSHMNASLRSPTTTPRQILHIILHQQKIQHTAFHFRHQRLAFCLRVEQKSQHEGQNYE